jgi:hypothetical protein
MPEPVQIPAPIQAIKEIINTPVGSVVTKAITTTTATVVTAFSLPEIILMPLRLLLLVLSLLGFYKKAKPWGVVYDSVTKRPLDPAYVILKNKKGKDVTSAITDLDGRYGFLADPGVYTMAANKTHYAFPSKQLAGKTKDEVYSNLYFGESIEIKTREDIINKNIPLDPVGFDWNEFAKQDKRLLTFYSRWDAVMRKGLDGMFYVGFGVAIIALLAAPYPYNLIIFGVYIFLSILRMLGFKPKPFGYVFDNATKTALSYAIVRIMLADSNTQITYRVTDKFGRYYCLLPNGSYYVKIEKKNSDGSYSLVYTSQILNLKKRGILKQTFHV